MKQKDIILIVLIAVISGVFSVFVSKALFSPNKKQTARVEVVDRITTDFATPDKKYFNDTSIDPTKNIKIGDGQNPNPVGKK